MRQKVMFFHNFVTIYYPEPLPCIDQFTDPGHCIYMVTSYRKKTQWRMACSHVDHSAASFFHSLIILMKFTAVLHHTFQVISQSVCSQECV